MIIRPNCSIDLDFLDTFPLLVLTGELDLTTATAVESTLLGQLDQARGIVLDLRGMTYIDALGIQALLNIGRKAKRAGKRLVLIDQVRPMRHELAACLVHRLIQIFPTTEHAREALPLEDNTHA